MPNVVRTLLWLLLPLLTLLLLIINVEYYLSTQNSGSPLPSDLITPRALLFHYSYLPRVVVAVLAGAALGAAGWLCQILLKNPLAEPATLGIASGAQLGLTLATLGGGTLWLTQGLSVAGALLAALIIFLLSLRQQLSPLTLLLSGLVIGLFCSALQQGLTLFHHEQLQNLFIWGSGNLAQNDWSVAGTLLPGLSLALLLILLSAKGLNLLRLSDEVVNSLGGRSQQLRLWGLLLVTLLAGWTISQTGLIGFIGLFAPQICRLFPRQRFVVDLLRVAAFGALILLCCDQVSLLAERAGMSITAGNVSAILGIPLMLVIIARARFINLPSLATARRRVRSVAGWQWWVLLLMLAALLSPGLVRTPEGWLFSWPDSDGYRWPRALLSASCGGLLALGGAILQRLTGNPLASPEVLGVNSGAACGVVLVLLFLPFSGPALLFPAALAGAMLSLMVILLFSLGRGAASSRILLAGTALSALSAAIISLLLASGAPNASRIISWLSGSAWGTRPLEAISGCATLAVALPISLLFSRWLTILPLGRPVAASLGISLPRVTTLLLLFCAVLSACATLLMGPMSFIGLLAPQLIRGIGVRHLQYALPLTVGAGAVLMLAADTLGRLVIWPFEIPAGVIAVLLGTPVFVYLLCRR